MTGYCSHCRIEGEVHRFRLAMVGLRWLDTECAIRLSAMGMHIEATVPEPRVADRGHRARRVWSGGLRRHIGALRSAA
jgi:hypothetical protein